MDWKADIAVPKQLEKQDKDIKDSGLNVNHLDANIKACGEKVRELKAKKADKVLLLVNNLVVLTYLIFEFHLLQSEIDATVKQLLSLKASFKNGFGVEWGPNVASSLTQADNASNTATATNQDFLTTQIKESGDKVRYLKAKKAEKVYTFHPKHAKLLSLIL